MLYYISKRLLLLIPTLFGILTLNFLLIQFAPGGPVERTIAQLENLNKPSESTMAQKSFYKATTGLDPELIDHINKLYGFDKPLLERYVIMMKNYIYFDFGESFYRQSKVLDIIKEKLPVSISLGVFSTLIIYLISIPLGIAKAKRNGSHFDIATSFVIIVANAIPSFLLAIFLIVVFAGGSYFDIFPLRGLVSEGFEMLSPMEKIKDYLWHLVLPVFCISLGGFAALTMLCKNCFLEEIHKTYVQTARAKGASESRILYKHIFRNAMLLVVSGFPVVFVSMFFSGSLLIEIIFSLDGLGLLGYESVINRDYPIIFGTLYIFTFLALVVGIISDVLYMFIDPRIHFDKRV